MAGYAPSDCGRAGGGGRVMRRSREGALSICRDACFEIAKNAVMAFPPTRAWRLKRPRAGALFSGTDEDLERYAFQATRSLLGLLKSVRGLRIVEIGPGDFLTSGLSLLAAGAASYTAIDRFPGNHQGAAAKAWYRGIEDAWPRVFPELPWPDDLKAEDFPENYPGRVEVISKPVEEVELKRHYDVVCSYQVGEHVSDIDSFARLNARLLARGGVAVHRVDLGPHGCWSNYVDPLIFLRFSEGLWWLMGSQRGTPNRFRHHEFCAAFERADLEVDSTGLEFFDEAKIDWSRLPDRFQKMPKDSLRVGTAIYTCRLR